MSDRSRRFMYDEGDLAIAPTWPESLPDDLAELTPADCRPQPGTPVAYSATFGTGPLGCDLGALPPVREK